MKTHLTVSICVLIAVYIFVHPSTEIRHEPSPQEESKVEVEVKPVAKNAIIELQLADWCGPCKKLKASGIVRELENKNWTVEYNDSIGGSFPTIRVWIKGKSRTFSGFSTKAAFYRTLNKHIRDLKK